jgi:uncharacterized protein (DUF1501 family)
VTVEVDARDFRAAAVALGSFDGIVDDVIGPTELRAGEVLEAAIRSAGSRHRATGKMLRNIKARPVGSGVGTRVRVTTGGSVAHLIVGGTRGHFISPTRGRALVLAGGELRSLAHHPGTRPDPFPARGIADAADELDRIYTDAGAAIVDQLADELKRRT